MGWTHARVRTSQRETKSFAPAGALHVETAARQAIGGLMTLPARASTKLSLGTFRRTAPDRWSRWVRLRDLAHPVRSTRSDRRRVLAACQFAALTDSTPGAQGSVLRWDCRGHVAHRVLACGHAFAHKPG